jgi:hypothetical protein
VDGGPGDGTTQHICHVDLSSDGCVLVGHSMGHGKMEGLESINTLSVIFCVIMEQSSDRTTDIHKKHILFHNTGKTGIYYILTGKNWYIITTLYDLNKK